MLNQRRALLAYLRRTDFEAFAYVMHSLGLRDNNYAKQVRAHGGPGGGTRCLRARVSRRGLHPQ